VNFTMNAAWRLSTTLQGDLCLLSPQFRAT
jgi:hypothetical protein